MKDPNLLSNTKARKLRLQRLKRLKRSYKAAHTAWEILNYYDLAFDQDIADGLNITAQDFEDFQKRTLHWLSQICKIRQVRIHKLTYGEDINITI